MMLAVMSCETRPQKTHAHADGSTHEGHAHSSDQLATVQYTVWSEKTELFVEFKPLVVGQLSRFTAHFTQLKGHTPYTTGTVTVSLVLKGKGIRSTVKAPEQTGIFTPALQPETAGSYQLIFDIQSDQGNDRLMIENIPVYSDETAAKKARVQKEAAIVFLKEQAWKMDFQTVQAMKTEMYEIIPTSGTWKVAPTDFKSLVAPANGIIEFNGSLTEGSRVQKGTTLLYVYGGGLTDHNLKNELTKARADFEQTQKALDRKKALRKSGIISLAEYEQAERAFRIAATNYETIQQGFSKKGKALIAPFDGYLKTVLVRNGDYATEGQLLLTLSKAANSLLESRIPANWYTQLDAIQNIWYQPSENTWSDLKSTGGMVLSTGKQVSATQPMLAIFAQVNEPVQRPTGSFSAVQIAIGTPELQVAVPRSALLEHYGAYSVIVQVSGEGFERRPVKVGQNNGKLVAITEGLQAGERVVSQGAFQIKMASLSGSVPAHGHAH